ncbi:MAG: PhoH family protein [Phycisphaerales bacterium]|nr:PhoH family protein [Phycisphaerales bacterium]
MDITIEIPPGVERVLMLGPGEGNLKMIRTSLGVSITARGDVIRIRGDEPAVYGASMVLSQLGAAADRNIALTSEQLQQALESVGTLPVANGDGQPAGAGRSARGEDAPATSHEPRHRDMDDRLDVYAAGRRVGPKTHGQHEYLDAIRDHDLVFTTGPAGTGKTYLAIAAAVHMLKRERVRRIVLVRPAVEAGEKLGYLPGDLQQKVNPYLRPLFDALHDMMDFATITRFMANDVVEIIPLAFMRGRTLNDAAVILDEAQNTTKGQMKMFLTRLGEQSKMIVMGDTSQIDLASPADSGLLDAVDRLAGVEGVAIVRLHKSDIVRHDLVQRIVDAYRSDEPASGGSNA